MPGGHPRIVVVSPASRMLIVPATSRTEHRHVGARERAERVGHAHVEGYALTVKKSTMMFARRNWVSGRHNDTKTAPAYWTSS